MDIAPEDALRLHVVLANFPQAIRIDEAKLTVHVLTSAGETQIKLNPTERVDRYLRRVRELISGQVLGSPGGYPLFLQRWTRMGQTRELHLEQLLLLGEPEAIVAVVNAATLTDELARRAWWAFPNSENARRMLECESVIRGFMGMVLVEYLLENLPFEQDPMEITATIRIILKTNLLDKQQLARLWSLAQRNSAYLLGFIQAIPHSLPEIVAARPDCDELTPLLIPLVAENNPYAQLLWRIISASGQNWLLAAEKVLRRAPNQEIVNAWLETVADYFALVRPNLPEAEIECLLAESQALCTETDFLDATPAGLIELRKAAPHLLPELRALLFFSRLSYAIVRPIFSRTTAVGALMQRKLEPIIAVISEQIAILRQSSSG